MATQADDEYATQRRQGDQHRVGPDFLDSESPQHDATDHPHESVGTHDDSVGGKAPFARADAAREMRGRVRGEGDDQTERHEPIALEEFPGRQSTEGGEEHDHRTGDDPTEWNDPTNDRPSADPEGPAMGESPAHLLFERQEETRRENEGREPERHDRFEGVLTECLLTDLEERVTRQSGDQESGTHGEGALRKGET